MLKRIFVIVLLVIVLPVTLFWVVNLLRERTAEPGVFVDETEQNVADPDSIVGAVIDKEKLLREINPLLSRLNRAVLDLRLLNEDTYSVFCDSFVGRDAVEFALSAGPINDWHTREVETGKPLEINARQRVDGLWAALIKPIQFFEQARFYGIKVTETNHLPQSFTTQVGFQALGRTKEGTWISIASVGEIEWESSADGWRIAVLDFPSFRLTESRY